MIELKDFVAETLKQVIDGVKAAQDHANKTGATINPEVPRHQIGGNLTFAGETLIETVEFDVAITTTDKDSTKGGIGVFVGPVGLGTQAQVEGMSSAMNRIRFAVHLVLPTQTRE